MVKNKIKEKLYPVYLLRGSDSLTKSEYVESLKNRVSENYPDFECITFYGGQQNTEEIINEIISPGLFAPYKIIKVKEADKLLKKGSSFRKFLVEYSKKEAHDSILILTTAKERLDIKGEIKSCDFKAPYQDKMPSWIISRAKKMGKQITPEAASLLAFKCGRNLFAADAELKKIIISFPLKKRVGTEEVKDVTGAYKKDDIFGYLDSLMNSDIDKALKILKNLLDFGDEPLRIIAMINWKLKQMIEARILMDRGCSEEDIINRMKLRPAFRYRGICFKLKKFSLKKLSRGYELLKEADLKLKSTGSEGRLVLEKFTFELLCC